MLILAMLVATAVTRYGVTDLIATVRGTESPRHRERVQRVKLAHEREMARLAQRQGPTITEAVAQRIAHRIAQPKPPKDRTGQRPARVYFGRLWEDGWNDAVDRHHRRHDRARAGDLPRQRAARRVRETVARWRTARSADRVQRTAPPDAEVPTGPAGAHPHDDPPTGPAGGQDHNQEEDRDDVTPEDQADAEHTCDYLISTDTPYGRYCGKPAVGKWHDDDDEWFCAAHMGDPDAAAEQSICPRCFAWADYRNAQCGSCDLPLSSPDDPAVAAEDEHDQDDEPADPPASHNTEGNTITMQTGEIYNPESALADATSISAEIEQLVAHLDASHGALAERGVTGAPLDAYAAMLDAANSLVAAANTAASSFTNHQEIHDVVHSDDTVGDGEYLELAQTGRGR